MHLRYRGAGCCSGFTITELVIVLALVALLTGFVLVALNSARRSAGEVEVVAALRHSFVAMTAYSTDEQLSLPFLGTPGAPNDPFVVGGTALEYPQGGFFGGQGRLWPTVLWQYFSQFPRVQSHSAFVDMSSSFGVNPASGKKVIATRLWLSHTAFAAPEYWVGETPPADSRLYRGTRLSQIRYPARKGLLLDIESGVWDGSQTDRKTKNDVFAACGDGAVRQQTFEPQAPWVARPHGASSFPTMSTLNGLQGTDF